MSLEWQARSDSLAWSNPVSWWWGLLTLVSGVNIAVWFVLYRELPLQPAGAATTMRAATGAMWTWPACRGRLDQLQARGWIADAGNPLAQARELAAGQVS